MRHQGQRKTVCDAKKWLHFKANEPGKKSPAYPAQSFDEEYYGYVIMFMMECSFVCLSHSIHNIDGDSKERAVETPILNPTRVIKMLICPPQHNGVWIEPLWGWIRCRQKKKRCCVRLKREEICPL